MSGERREAKVPVMNKENAVPEQKEGEADDLALTRDIAREVEEAFANVPCPGDDRLLAYPDYYESDAILEVFPGKHWRELVFKIPPEHDVSVKLFSPEAFRFYLPAYLITALLDPPELGIFLEYTLGSLTPPDSKPLRRQWFLGYISPLDARQKAAIRRFVELAIPEAKGYPYPRDDRALFFWQRIAEMDHAEEVDASDQDTDLLKLRKAMLGESVLSEQEAREVKALEQEIAQEVEQAFATVTLPGDDGSPDSSARWKEVPEEFRDKHWKALSLEVLSRYYKVRLFSPEAFCFFLPAYLIAALLHAEETDLLRDEVFYDLTPPREEGRLMDLFLARIDALDARQKAVVRRFVELWARTATLYPDALRSGGSPSGGRRAGWPHRSR